MTFLNSELTSSMAIKKNEDFINDYSDILRFRKMQIYAEADSTLSALFTKASTDLLRRLSTRLVPVRGTFRYGPELFSLIKKVSEKQGVLVGSEHMGISFMLQSLKVFGYCPKTMVTTKGFGLLSGDIFLSRSLPSELTRNINKGIHICRESNLYRQKLLWTVHNYYKCMAFTFSNKDEPKPLSSDDILGSLVLLAIGLGVSLVALTVEGISRTIIYRKRSTTTRCLTQEVVQ
ncbi:uncharacterized protein LOC111251635 [Varroa destructor]|uniref:Uncharacterized protein n=2 Tax=Varroa TaxID=62624 RepID=A0A7M7MBH4_VARDE|nr:uncharacterized protein LOC111251635 [Varroa destructor]